MRRRLALGTVALAFVLVGCGSTGPAATPGGPASPGASGPAVTPAIPAAEESLAPVVPPTVSPDGAPSASGSPAPAESPSALASVMSGALVLEPDSLPATPDAGVDTPCSAEGSARSIGDTAPSTYSIANKTQNAYRVYWLDYDGRRQPWFDLTPGSSNTQRTYESHAWMVTDATDRCLGIFHAPADLTIQPTQPQPPSGPIFPTAAPSSGPSSPTDEAAGRASLLVAADVPAGATSDGVRLFQEDAQVFTSNGGLRGIGQEWAVGGDIRDIYDERWQFQTPAGAKAFFQAAEQELSLQASGLTKQTSMEAAGPDGVVYAAQLQTTGGVIQSYYNFLFVDATFVARVFVAGSQDLDPAKAIDIAKSAAGRVAAVTGTAGPGGGQAGSFPNAAEAALLGHVPGPIRTSCGRDPNTPDVAKASVVCPLQGKGAGAVKYIALKDASRLPQLFQARVASLGAASTGQSCREGPSNSPWSINGEKHGDVFCYADEGAAWIEWTDERFGIYSMALRADLAWSTLYEWWVGEAGPE